MGYRYSETAAKLLDWRVDPEGSTQFVEKKLIKHIYNNDVEHVIAYLYKSFQHWDPKQYKQHSAYPILTVAVHYLQRNGWKVKFANCDEQFGKDYGFQVVISNDGFNTFYHSNYKKDWPIKAEYPIMFESITEMIINACHGK